MRMNLCILSTVVALAGAAQAKEIAGVNMPDTVSAGGKTLKLNGVGLRKKFIVKVYVGAMYVESPTSDANAIIHADAPKAMHMHFVHNVGKEKIVEAWREGFEANAKDKAAAEKPNIDKLCSMMSDVKDGEEYTYTYVPGVGTKVTLAGKDLGTIPGKSFAEALWSVWLGPNPPTEDLKKGLLGQ